MMQQRYHTRHYDSGAPRGEATAGSRALPPHNLASIAEPGLQAGDVSTLRFLASRKLRRFDVEGPSPVSLSLNGQPLGIVKPGQNTFEPPIPLNPGDVLQLEVLELADKADDPMHSGWNAPESLDPQSGDSHAGRR